MTSRSVRRERARKLSSEILDFKEQLAFQRAHKSLSQLEVAERMGISQSSVSEFERYDSNPTLKTVLMYAAAVEALLELRVVDDCGAHTPDEFNQLVSTDLHWNANQPSPAGNAKFREASNKRFAFER